MTGFKIHLLLQNSPAYQAYKALDTLPPNAPPFELNDEGDPIVEIHEEFCRVQGIHGGICGERLSGRSNLTGHVNKVHKARPAARVTGIGSTRRYRTAHEFYISLMKDVDYPGKRTSEEEMALSPFIFGEPMEKQQRRPKNNRQPRFGLHTNRSDNITGIQEAEPFASEPESTTPNTSSTRSIRRRHGVLSPDPDDSEGNGARDDSTHQAPAANTSKRPKLTSSEPKVKVEHEFIVIEDDIVEVGDRPSSSGGTRHIESDVACTEGTVDYVEEKQVVLTTDNGDGEFSAEALGSTNVARGEAIEQEDVQPSTAAEEVDMDDMEIELEMSQIKQAKLQARLEELQLKKKIAGLKKRKAGS